MLNFFLFFKPCFVKQLTCSSQEPHVLGKWNRNHSEVTSRDKSIWKHSIQNAVCFVKQISAHQHQRPLPRTSCNPKEGKKNNEQNSSILPVYEYLHPKQFPKKQIHHVSGFFLTSERLLKGVGAVELSPALTENWTCLGQGTGFCS